MDKRRKRVTWGPLPKGTRVRTSAAYWQQPLRWNREAQAAGERRRVFCASLADVFEDWKGNITVGAPMEFRGDYWRVLPDGRWWVPGFYDKQGYGEIARPATMQDMREELFRLIEDTPWLDWLLLTKRPENVMGMVPESWQKAFPRNVWLGTSVENQKYADFRIPELIKCPAAIRFLSCEPLLAKIDLTRLGGDCSGCTDPKSEGTHQLGTTQHPACPSLIHWVIIGGESGPKARPAEIAWVRSLIEQCQAANVATFVKQLGAIPSMMESEWRSLNPTPLLSANKRDRVRNGAVVLALKHSHGGDIEEWPTDLRVREFPTPPSKIEQPITESEKAERLLHLENGWPA
jgi:protein gp37